MPKFNDHQAQEIAKEVRAAMQNAREEAEKDIRRLNERNREEARRDTGAAQLLTTAR